jgi:uncharacterized protein
MLSTHLPSGHSSLLASTLPDAGDHPTPWTSAVRPWNPLHDDACARQFSSYLKPSAEGLQCALDDSQPSDAADQAIHGRLKEKILGNDFPCVAARSVMNRGTYRFGVYESLGTPQAAFALCHDLYEFTHEFPTGLHPFTSYMAAFKGPAVHSECDFEKLLWEQLQLMHGIDARYFDWDGSVSKDPDSPNFSFSVGGRAFFVVGLNRCASRHARYTGESFIVFNPHDQFEALRASGKYEQLQKAIRQRDIAVQGSINPMLQDFGSQSESRQYAGRAVPAQWRCPFHSQANPHA